MKLKLIRSRASGIQLLLLIQCRDKLLGRWMSRTSLVVYWLTNHAVLIRDRTDFPHPYNWEGWVGVNEAFCPGSLHCTSIWLGGFTDRKFHSSITEVRGPVAMPQKSRVIYFWEHRKRQRFSKDCILTNNWADLWPSANLFMLVALSFGGVYHFCIIHLPTYSFWYTVLWRSKFVLHFL